MYGLYIANRTILELAEQERESLPRAAAVLRTDVYVDDIITGTDSESDALSLQQELITLMKSGGYELRKWISNSSAILQGLPDDHKQLPLLFENSENPHTVAVLGVLYDPVRDVFSYKLNLGASSSDTKRSILSVVARIFDPKGWICPVVYWVKCLLQRFWLNKLDWNDPLPSDLLREWQAFREDLVNLKRLAIPRCTMTKPASSYSLHGFCDASELGFAAVVYLRSSNQDGSVSVHLLMAKSKVAPLRTRPTIPKLELCGAVLLVKLLNHRVKWTDSTSPPKEGDLVLLKEDNVPPLQWNRGRIIKLYPGSDGVVRLADIRVANGATLKRAIGMRILVMLLLDTLPMLGNVLLLCFFVFFIFGIVGVQLWEGILRQRCELVLPPNVIRPNVSFYYEFSKELDYICTTPEDSGMHHCGDFPPYRYGQLVCNDSAKPFSYNHPTNSSCVNWNQYYTNCTQRGSNPFQGTISFDNIGLAWVAIFLVISLEGWTDIMYYVQDAHSFWDWIYFVLLIVIGSFFMINLCLVVIATQFSETKKREMERMRAERARFTSSSTLASSTNNSEPATCYAEIVKYVAHLWRRFKRRMAKKIRVYRYQRAQSQCRRSRETLQLPAHKPRQHHPCCPRVHPQANGGAKEEIGAGDEPIGRPSLLRVPSLSAADLENTSNLSLLSPPSLARRRSSVMFSDTVLLHAPPPRAAQNNVCCSEKMTQTEFELPPGESAEARAAVGGAMSCQELLALSGALSAALPTGQVALDTFFEELTKGISKRAGEEKTESKVC
ncbi:unnamed protein product [Plutella xylostella]|uniref:(diamondback moth) hypothetical protein n=1 Tax=Plutella xylostella TaxID=51655 RepID=A0A8S4FXW0_PLUXY|nr:unnamed protein product [Plutella xylostella]